MGVEVFGVRHGLVENPDHVVYARLPQFSLSTEGRQASERLATALSDRDIRAVVASPLERAQETAQILAAPHALDVRTEPRLIEWSFWTRWEGMPWAQLRDLEPGVFAIYARDPGELHAHDSLAHVGRDIVAWTEEVSLEFDEGIVLAVSHEAPLKAAYLASRGEPTSGYPGIQVPHLGGVRLHPGPARIVDLSQDVERN